MAEQRYYRRGSSQNIQSLHSIAIFNLSYHIKPNDLYNEFRIYGRIDNIHIPRDYTNKSRGFGFIRFFHTRDAADAFMHNYKILYGRCIKIDWARNDSRQAPRKPQRRDNKERYGYARKTRSLRHDYRPREVSRERERERSRDRERYNTNTYKNRSDKRHYDYYENRNGLSRYKYINDNSRYELPRNETRTSTTIRDSYYTERGRDRDNRRERDRRPYRDNHNTNTYDNRSDKVDYDYNTKRHGSSRYKHKYKSSMNTRTRSNNTSPRHETRTNTKVRDSYNTNDVRRDTNINYCNTNDRDTSSKSDSNDRSDTESKSETNNRSDTDNSSANIEVPSSIGRPYDSEKDNTGSAIRIMSELMLDQYCKNSLDNEYDADCS